MDLCPEVWNVLHDAVVTGVSGQVPGTVRLEIEADYLRRRFVDPGQGFVLTLIGCRTFAFRSWAPTVDVLNDLREISRLRLVILSADATDEHCVIHCSTGETGGVLHVSAGAATLALDSGDAVSFEAIASVAEEYWAEFEAGGSTPET